MGIVTKNRIGPPIKIYGGYGYHLEQELEDLDWAPHQDLGDLHGYFGPHLNKCLLWWIRNVLNKIFRCRGCQYWTGPKILDWTGLDWTDQF